MSSIIFFNLSDDEQHAGKRLMSSDLQRFRLNQGLGKGNAPDFLILLMPESG
jgi:hypothetical protein